MEEKSIHEGAEALSLLIDNIQSGHCPGVTSLLNIQKHILSNIENSKGTTTIYQSVCGDPVSIKAMRVQLYEIRSHAEAAQDALGNDDLSRVLWPHLAEIIAAVDTVLPAAEEVTP